MRGHDICFHREIRKNIFELSSKPPVIWGSGLGVFPEEGILSLQPNRYGWHLLYLFSILTYVVTPHMDYLGKASQHVFMEAYEIIMVIT